MRRRRALAGLAAMLAGAAIARAQVRDRPARVGLIFVSDTPESIDGFRARLAALGWVEGRNLDIVRPASGSDYDALRSVAAALVAGGIDVIVTRGSATTRAVRAATTSVPIVAITGADLVALGYAASPARPGGNLTQIGTNVRDLEAKRLDLLREALPELRRIVTVYSPGSPGQVETFARMRVLAGGFGFALEGREILRLEDLDDAVAALASGGPAALVPVGSTLLQTPPGRRRLVELALRHRMPSMFIELETVRAGGLMSYGVDAAAIWVRAAEYVDRILRGTKPGDLPIEEPSRLHLAINLATARALGITLPPTVVARADEVIE